MSLVFTGLVQDLGEVHRVDRTSDGVRISVKSPLAGELSEGDSVAVNGVCLTATGMCGGELFGADVMEESLRRSSLGELEPGSKVNLELPLRAADRLGGHVVQGHVDGVGTVLRVRRLDDAVLVDIAVPAEVAELLVPHGSITVDGVSLTVNAIPEPAVVQLSLIEYTLRHTTLGTLDPGDAVHVEGDVIGKYVRQLMHPYKRDIPGTL